MSPNPERLPGHRTQQPPTPSSPTLIFLCGTLCTFTAHPQCWHLCSVTERSSLVHHYIHRTLMIIWSSICPLSPRLLLYPAFVGVSLAGVFVLSTSGIIHCSRVAQSHLFKEFSRIKAGSRMSMFLPLHAYHLVHLCPLTSKSYRLTVVWLSCQPHHKAHTGMMGAHCLYSPPSQGQEEFTWFEPKLRPIYYSERVSSHNGGPSSRSAGGKRAFSLCKCGFV